MAKNEASKKALRKKAEAAAEEAAEKDVPVVFEHEGKTYIIEPEQKDGGQSS